MFQKAINSVLPCLCGTSDEADNSMTGTKLRGRVVLMKKNVLDFNDFSASVRDRVDEFLGGRVSLHLVSEDPSNGLEGKLGRPAYLEGWISTFSGIVAGETAFNVWFDWEEEMGIPGSFIIRNNHHSEFYLKNVTLEHVPGHGTIHFPCNSWVYPAKRYQRDRVFFTNKAYLPSETPAPLQKYRVEELVNLRGQSNTHGELEEWDRVYDYAYYNDLGDPDKGSDYARPVLGGSTEFPYPRRGKTGRPPTKKDPNTESRLPLLMGLNIYVPRDERFGHLKMSDFLASGLKSIAQFLVPELEALADKNPEFDTFQDVLNLYEGGIRFLDRSLLDRIRQNIPFELLKQLVPADGKGLLKYSMPQVIKEDKSAWKTDEEFAREMLAGVNPVAIRCLKVFPPRSQLDPKLYGNQDSSITTGKIEDSLNGFTVEEAIKNNRLFILDYHDILMPYLRLINTTSTKAYATRTILFLKDDGSLKPLAIELSVPHPNGDQHGAISRIFTPDKHGVEGSIWQLAKAYAAVNDSGFHQLISHWLHSHVVIEPFVIATNRQLSVLHPIYKLLHPHFRDTMNINALARQILINAGGILETTVFPSKFAMELSASAYKEWVFPDQALPADLIKRGMAVKNSEYPHGLRLLIEDYPYAVDGLEIWSAIETWVREYCLCYYRTDEAVRADPELQSWWEELRNEGHGDKKNEPWWPEMKTRHGLTETCTIIIWLASALHAAVNFGQYPYSGYNPNRPSLTRRFMPEPGSAEYEELRADPEKFFLRTITPKKQTLLGIALIQILSIHSTDEVYLGQRESGWTSDRGPLEAFERFGRKLADIEAGITERNNDRRLKNRSGPAKVPYTLLFPTSEGGLTGKGVPNSTSI